MSRKRPKPRRRKAVPLDLSSAERELLIENTPFLDEWVLERLRLAIVDQATCFPVDALVQMGDHLDLAAACELDARIRRRLELIQERIERTLSTYGLVPPPEEREPRPRVARILQFPRNDASHGAHAGDGSSGARAAGELPSKSGLEPPEKKGAPLEHAGVRVALSRAQRRRIAEWFPAWTERLRGDEPRTLRLPFHRVELVRISRKARRRLTSELSRRERLTLQKILEAAEAKTWLYRVRITLLGVYPPVWRVARIPDCTLRELHEYLRALMGWTDQRGYFFHVGGIPIEDDGRRRLSDLTGEPFRKLDLLYEYDIDASWTHRVIVEKRLRVRGDEEDIACLEGRGACPPEGVLDPSDYAEFVEVLLDANHEDHLSAVLWAEGFDPDRFSAQAATQRIQEVERGTEGYPAP